MWSLPVGSLLSLVLISEEKLVIKLRDLKGVVDRYQRLSTFSVTKLFYIMVT